MSKELGVSYNVSKLEPKLKSHQFPGFLNGLPTNVMLIEIIDFLCGYSGYLQYQKLE